MKDEKILESMALKGKNWMQRREAASRLENQKVLEHVAHHDKVWRVRIEAVKRLDNREVLGRLLYRESEGIVVHAAGMRYLALLETVTDQKELAEVASADLPDGIREMAISRLESQDLLEKLAVDDKSWRVREKAARRLQGYPALAEMLLLETDRFARQAAEKQGANLIEADA